MAHLTEPEERRVREYVQSQLRDDDDPVTLVQKVGSRRVAGRSHAMYDVRSRKNRWWVISDLMNFYSQDDFHSLEMAFTYHLGFCMVLAERARTETDDDKIVYAGGAWRRFRQAAESMDDADEAEQFQAIGVQCREALLALVRDQADKAEVNSETERPQIGNFKAWLEILVRELGGGRLRSYLTTVGEKTWDLAVALQHDANATPWDAEIVLDATANVISTFSQAMIKRDKGTPDRCPVCGSYRLVDDGEVMTVDGRMGYTEWKVCAGCDWESDRGFDAWD